MIAAAWMAAALATLCLEPDGSLTAPVCAAPASRLDARTQVCECPNGRRTEASFCAPGEAPAPETRALSTFRRKAAADGSLVGDRFKGRPLCVVPSAPPARRP